MRFFPYQPHFFTGLDETLLGVNQIFTSKTILNAIP
jgi:hypothetical protein